MKAEELKRKHRFTNIPKDAIQMIQWEGKSFYLTESELDEYAQQVSKEREKKVFNDARMDFIGYHGRQYKYENFDVWEEEQENE